ncbi:MAG: MATE family efflux transporter [Myxococcales bacterium]|nr:MATE family efflux transporter [Myxococcales bacterium]
MNSLNDPQEVTPEQWEAVSDLPAQETVWRGLYDLLRIGLPTTFVNFSLTMMQITDTWMVASLGTDELAAITPPGLVIFVLQSFGYGLLSSSTAFVAQSLGRNKPHDCGSYAWQGIHIGVVVGFAMLSLWWVAGPLFGFFHEPGTRVWRLEVGYFQAAIFSLLPAMISVALSSFYVGVQRNRIVVVSSTCALLANVVLNYGLIFGELGMPKLGLAGAGWGTVAAASMELVVLMALFVAPATARAFGTWRVMPRLQRQLQIFKVGIPAGIQGVLETAGWGLVLSWFVAFFGTAHQAATTVLIRCMQISFMPAEGFAMASLTLVGNAVGGGHIRLAEQRARLGFRLVATYMTTMGILFYVFRDPILRFFTEDPEVIAIGSGAMVILALFQVFDAMSVTYVHVLQGVGDNLWPLTVSVVLSAGVLIGGGLVVVYLLPELGSLGLWALIGLFALAQGVAFRTRWQRGRWAEFDLLDEAV